MGGAPPASLRPCATDGAAGSGLPALVEELDCHRPRDPASYAGGGTRSRHGRKRERWESGEREAAVLLEEREGEESEEKKLYFSIYIWSHLSVFIFSLSVSDGFQKSSVNVFS